MRDSLPWAEQQLTTFIDLSSPDRFDVLMSAPTHEQIVEAAAIAEVIVDRELPNWREEIPASSRAARRWQQLREAGLRARALIRRRVELEAHLRPQAPTLSAGGFHPWVWDGARSMWGMAAYDRAVEDALARVTYEAQCKSGLNRLGETKLFQLLFSLEDPKPDAPRLRLQPADGVTETPETFRNRHLAVHALAQGLYAGLRNPAAHGVRTSEGEQQVALERLAAVSVLARWVHDAAIVTTVTR